MTNIFKGDVIIKNSRTGGQDPNTLGAAFDQSGGLSPVLGVKGHEPPLTIWTIVPTNPNFPDVSPSFIQMKAKNGSTYNLGVTVPPESGTICVMNEIGKTPAGTVFDQWYFPYDSRILLAYDLIDPDRQQLALDTGRYPQVAVWEFDSSVNQTWQITPA